MLISPAYAQDAAGLLGGATQFVPLILIFGVFYFMMIRPQQQRAKDTKKMQAELKRGDRVVTSGGLLGVVQKTRDTELEVEIAPNVRVSVLRDSVTSLATDAKP